jgi:hypothetical protein
MFRLTTMPAGAPARSEGDDSMSIGAITLFVALTLPCKLLHWQSQRPQDPRFVSARTRHTDRRR